MFRLIKRGLRVLGGSDIRCSDIDRWGLWAHNVNALHGNLKRELGPVREYKRYVLIHYCGREYVISELDNKAWVTQCPLSYYKVDMFPVMLSIGLHCAIIASVHKTIQLAEKGIPVYTSSTPGGRLMEAVYKSHHYAVNGKNGKCQNIDLMSPPETTVPSVSTPRVSRIPNAEMDLTNPMNPLSPVYIGNSYNDLHISQRDTQSGSSSSDSSDYSSSSSSSSGSSSYD